MRQRILILLALSYWCNCMNPYNVDQMSEQQMRATKATFCGSELSSALSLVCKGAYNVQSKKSSKYYTRTIRYNRDVHRFVFNFLHLSLKTGKLSLQSKTIVVFLDVRV